MGCILYPTQGNKKEMHTLAKDYKSGLFIPLSEPAGKEHSCSIAVFEMVF